MMKRVLSILLVLVLLTGMVPAYAQTQEESTTAVDNGDLTVEGTNGFGDLLAEDIAQQQATLEEQEHAGYTLTDLEITGNTATVTYDSLEEATVVVAIYTEDGMQMVTSGQTTVIPEETTATVTIDGEMPQYFMATAYLLDSYDMSPLCPAYDTPMYTKEMQELLASTAEDYDPDRVLQLEENPETNFAVYADTTKVIEPVEGVNTVSSINKETNTYIIENADDHFTSLQIGDIISYPYGENEILIIKVAAITVDGTTVTVTGSELELQDVFSHVKIEGQSETEDITVDDSTVYEGITYEGVVTEGNMTRAISGGASEKVSHKFEFNQKIEGETEHLSASLAVGGYFNIQLEVGVNYYVSWTTSYVEFKTTFSMTAGLNMDGHISGSLPIGTFGVSPCPGVFVGFEPKLVLKFTGTVDISVTFDVTMGFRYDNKSGLQNISTKPKITPSCTVEAALFLGVDFAPKITILGDDTLKIGLSATVGVELKAKAKGSNWEIPTGEETELHACRECLDISMTFKASLSGSITFLDFDWMAVNIDIGNWEIPLGNAYYSLDDGAFGFGSCPNVKYRLTITVSRSIVPVAGVKVKTAAGAELGTTNSNGVVIAFLPAGKHQLVTVIDGKKITKNITVTQEAIVRISELNTENTGSSGTTTGKPNILDNITEEDKPQIGIVDQAKITASGTCGDNLTWELYDNGSLHISGRGKMYDYIEPIWDIPDRMPPWCEYRITTVNIQQGVTSIGECAFYGCDNLTSVTIPNSVTSIGDNAFFSCYNLTSVTIPNSVTSIGDNAFKGCAIWVSEDNPYFSNDSHGVLFNKNKTTLLQFPYIYKGHYTIPNSVTSIGDSAFFYCDNLTSVTIPNSVTSIGDSAFSYCDNLTSVTIPNSVTSIGDSAFSDCENLTSVTIPNSVTSIEYNTFSNCENLTSVTISNSVTSIGNYVFWSCNNLKDIYYTGTQAQWNAISIGSHNDSLTNATIHYNSTGAAALVAGDDIAVSNGSLSGQIGGQMSSANAVFGGNYGTEITDHLTVKTADFTGLVAGKEYVLLALAELDAQEPLAADNLLFIDQAVADEDGCLSFRYVQRVNMDLSYVMACGASNKDLNHAEITFPNMFADGEIQIVQPTVVYDGKTLVEGQDYVISGDVDFTEAGEYICYIRGIYNYTGLVTCTYQVSDLIQPTLTLKSPTLEFKDMITVNAMFTAENIEDVVEMGMITYSSKVDVWNVETAEYVIPGTSYDAISGRYIAHSQGIHAKYLGDTVYLACYAKLTDGSYVYTKLAPYSPVQYATNQLKNSTDLKLKQLVAAMLNYGAAAQQYFLHNPDHLANASMTEEQKQLPEAYRADMVGSVPAASADKQGIFANNKGFSKRYPAISFEGAFCINYFFAPAYTPVGDVTLYYWNEADFEAAEVLTKENASGTLTMAIEESGQYRGDIEGIAAKSLSAAIYVAAVYTDSTTQWSSGVLGYSIGAYCSGQVSKGAEVAALAEATAVYGYQAKQYFG